MQDEFLVSDNEKLDFKNIVLEHLKHILNITCVKSSYGSKVSAYVDATESLADCLLPFFDDEMKKAYKKYNEEIVKAETNNSIRVLKKVGRDLFRATNELMGRKNYLKKAMYNEEDDEDGEDDEDES